MLKYPLNKTSLRLSLQAINNWQKQIEILVHLNGLNRGREILAAYPMSSIPPPPLVFPLRRRFFDVTREQIANAKWVKFDYKIIEEAVDKLVAELDVSPIHFAKAFIRSLQTFFRVQNNRKDKIRTLFLPIKIIPDSLRPIKSVA